MRSFRRALVRNRNMKFVLIDCGTFDHEIEPFPKADPKILENLPNAWKGCPVLYIAVSVVNNKPMYQGDLFLVPQVMARSLNSFSWKPAKNR